MAQHEIKITITAVNITHSIHGAHDGAKINMRKLNYSEQLYTQVSTPAKATYSLQPKVK